MNEISTIGLDLAKNVFQLRGMTVGCNSVLLRRNHSFVIPGRATWREPGIHNHEIAFGA